MDGDLPKFLRRIICAGVLVKSGGVLVKSGGVLVNSGRFDLLPCEALPSSPPVSCRIQINLV
jgi:hypothetical protein